MKKQFLFYLLDTPTGKAYYIDSNGIIQTTSIITATQDVSMSSSPGNWLDTELGFIRNETYYGLNRSYATGQQFVKKVAYMVRKLYYSGVGTEVPLTVAVFKYNSQPQPGEPNYKLYFKAQVDLPEIKDKPIYDTNVNLMEGGVGQLLKAYENTVFQIPCDGSIGENVKANLDGVLLNNTIYYDIVPNAGLGDGVIPLIKIREDGDSFGVGSGSQDFFRFDTFGGAYYFQTSPSQALYFNHANTVRIKGSITVNIKRLLVSRDGYFLATGTNKSEAIGLGDTITFSKSLTGQAAPYPNPSAVGIYPKVEKFVGTKTFYFDVYVPLDPYEKLLFWQQVTTDTGGTVDTEIIAGNIAISFASKYPPTRPWAITLLDLFKQIVSSICIQAGINGQNFAYYAKSDLLTQHLGVLATSGDALRASGDPTYQNYFHPQDLNGNTSYGPVIKMSLKRFFEDVSAIFCAGMGPEQTGNIEQLFIESLDYVFDSSVITMELGEVSDLELGFNKAMAFSDIQIGYAPQSYDQKAGKYESNTTLKMKAPVISFKNELIKVCQSRTDSYGIERVRSNIGATTSTTRNDSDNDVFFISTDNQQFIYDYFKSYFNSLIPNPDSVNNTNINLVSDRTNQPTSLPRTDGEYFQPNLDQAIFVFNVTGYSATESCNLSIAGVINEINHIPGSPADTITFKLWLNGVVIFTDTTTVAGINTPIAINYNFSQLLAFRDCIYVTAETSATGVADITTCVLTIGTYVTMTGQFIPVDSGTGTKLISMPLVVPTSTPYDGSSKVYYNYQYFLYNSLAVNNDFTISANVTAYTQGTVGNVTVYFYINGLRQATVLNIPCQATRTLQNITVTFPSATAFNLGDTVFMTVDVPNGMNIGITDMYINFDSDQTKAYSLLRYNYDSLTGVPNIATDPLTGLPSTTVAGAPYNIEPFSPKRMYINWKKFIKSGFLNQVGGDMKFMDLSKNKYLSTVRNGITITEASNEPILDGGRLFYPIPVSFTTKVPLTFSEVLTGAANGHIHFTYFGKDLYFFPTEVKQKPGLNEAQTWSGLLSPRTDINILPDLINSLNLSDMAENSIKTAILTSLQFVPQGATQPAKYHTKSRNHYMFNEQVDLWQNKDNYYQLYQIGDVIPLQHISHSLDPLSYVVYKCDGTEYIAATNLTTVTSNAVVNPYVLWQALIDTASWERGDYYVKVTGGVGSIAATVGSEYIRVLTPSECEDTVLLEYTSSYNTQGMVFDANIPFRGAIRFVGGFSNKFKQKYLGKFYIDQPANISILGAIPYEITSLVISQVPDWMARKILRALLLDGATLDGEGFSLDEGAQFEEIFTKGAPMKFQKIDIRPTDNNTGISTVASGIDIDGSVIATLDAEAFGPNANNASGSTAPDIIGVTLN